MFSCCWGENDLSPFFYYFFQAFFSFLLLLLIKSNLCRGKQSSPQERNLIFHLLQSTWFTDFFFFAYWHWNCKGSTNKQKSYQYSHLAPNFCARATGMSYKQLLKKIVKNHLFILTEHQQCWWCNKISMTVYLITSSNKSPVLSQDYNIHGIAVTIRCPLALVLISENFKYFRKMSYDFCPLFLLDGNFAGCTLLFLTCRSCPRGKYLPFFSQVCYLMRRALIALPF